ncbi:MAG: WG repeat-containing protein [Chitinophagaceae bacterium]
MKISSLKKNFVIIVLLAVSTGASAQYVSSYNNSFTGPNLNRAKEESYNRQMRDEQEKWRQKRYEEERKTKKYTSYSSSGYDLEEKKPVVKNPVAKKVPEPKKSKYDYVSTYIDGLAEASLKGKSGYVDIYEKEVVPVIYDEVYLFWDGLSAVKLNGKFGYVDKKGTVVIPLKYDQAWHFEAGKATVVLNKKETFINKNGTELFPFKYDNLYALNDGLIQAWLNKKTGFIDITGKELIPVIYDSVTYQMEGGKKMFLRGLHYYFDKNGKPMRDVYDYIGETDDEGEAFVMLNEKWGKIDQKAKIILPLKYDNMLFTENGMTGVNVKGKWGFINDDEKETIRPQFDTVVTNFNVKGMAIVKNGKQMFIIDKAGKKLKTITSLPNIEPEAEKPSSFATSYEQTGETSEGLTAVAKNKKWGFINAKGVLVVPLKYDDVMPFENGLASVVLNEKWGYVNKVGKEIVAVKYDNIDFFSNGFAGVKVNEKWGFVNTQGVMVIKPQYDNAGRFNKKGKATVIIKEEYYWIDRTGKILEKQ